MESHRVRCTLAVASGPRRRVGPQGLVIGRQADCDLVVTDLSVSRRHALVRLTSDGAELVPLGRSPVTLNGAACPTPHALHDADRIQVGELALVVELAAIGVDADAPAAFQLAREGGESYGLAHSPFVIGGAPSDDLIIKRWPPHALVLHVAHGELCVEVAEGTASRNGVELPAGTLEPLEVGDTLGFRKESFVVQRSAAHAATTVLGAVHGAPSHVQVELLPRGGRIVFGFAMARYAVFLHDRRLDLLMALLRPPAGYQAGEFIPDESVSAVVWPRKVVSRTDLNILISRCRKDLIQAGLAGMRMIERAPGGGATRIVLAPGAEVVVQ